MRNTSLMASINIMKGVYIFSICMLFSSQTLASDMENSLMTYSENFNQILPCSDNILCLERFQYRKDMKDFVLIVERKFDDEFDSEKYKTEVNGLDMILLSVREKLTAVDGGLSFILDSKNTDVDEMIRKNLNIVIVTKYLSSYFLAVSTRDERRRFRFDIQTQEELDYYTNEYLEDTLN
jgi:hypothetical protein